jgi:hypothetical protein
MSKCIFMAKYVQVHLHALFCLHKSVETQLSNPEAGLNALDISWYVNSTHKFTEVDEGNSMLLDRGIRYSLTWWTNINPFPNTPVFFNTPIFKEPNLLYTYCLEGFITSICNRVLDVSIRMNTHIHIIIQNIIYMTLKNRIYVTLRMGCVKKHIECHRGSARGLEL